MSGRYLCYLCYLCYLFFAIRFLLYSFIYPSIPLSVGDHPSLSLLSCLSPTVFSYQFFPFKKNYQVDGDGDNNDNGVVDDDDDGDGGGDDDGDGDGDDDDVTTYASGPVIWSGSGTQEWWNHKKKK